MKIDKNWETRLVLESCFVPKQTDPGSGDESSLTCIRFIMYNGAINSLKYSQFDNFIYAYVY